MVDADSAECGREWRIPKENNHLTKIIDAEDSVLDTPDSMYTDDKD